MDRPHCPACGGSRRAPSLLGGLRYGGRAYPYWDCAGCGSTFLDPAPDDATRAELFGAHYLLEHYGDELRASTPEPDRAEQFHQALGHVLPRVRGGRLLDVGCGPGAFLRAARQEGLTVEGLELLPEVASLVSRTVGVTVHHGTLADLLQKPDRYDLIAFENILALMPEPLAALEAARALLSPRGVVMTRGPLEAQPHLFQQAMLLRRVVRGRLGHAALTDLPPWASNLFSLRGYRAMAARARLRPVVEEITEDAWPALPSSSRPVRAVKRLSQRLSASAMGKLLGLGNAAFMVLEPLG